MSAIYEARSLIIDIAGPVPLGAKVKTILARVADASGLSERRIRGIWNEEARAVLADELEALRQAKAAEELRRREDSVHAINEGTWARLERTQTLIAARREDLARRKAGCIG